MHLKSYDYGDNIRQVAFDHGVKNAFEFPGFVPAYIRPLFCQGLPSRICWIGLGDRHKVGMAFNQMVADDELKAPIVIGRDHLDSGSV